MLTFAITKIESNLTVKNILMIVKYSTKVTVPEIDDDTENWSGKWDPTVYWYKEKKSPWRPTL